jgi:predicted ArsR family transcriptional regulator
VSRSDRRDVQRSDQVQHEARALGDPTRHRIFRYVAEAAAPVGIAELTDMVQLNHNAVRQHLAVLKEAGLVDEQVERRDRPGRPRLLYRMNPDVGGSWGTDGPYELLASLLSEVVRTGTTPRHVGQLAGRRLARRRPPGSHTLDALRDEMVAGGFRPVATPAGDGCDFVLRRCPFVEVAANDPGTVCQVHLGLAEGVAAELDDGAVVGLVAKDPRRAGCCISVRTGASHKPASHQ